MDIRLKNPKDRARFTVGPTHTFPMGKPCPLAVGTTVVTKVDRKRGVVTVSPVR